MNFGFDEEKAVVLRVLKRFWVLGGDWLRK